jgi:hypothetical protein
MQADGRVGVTQSRLGWFAMAVVLVGFGFMVSGNAAGATSDWTSWAIFGMAFTNAALLIGAFRSRPTVARWVTYGVIVVGVATIVAMLAGSEPSPNSTDTSAMI